MSLGINHFTHANLGTLHESADILLTRSERSTYSRKETSCLCKNYGFERRTPIWRRQRFAIVEAPQYITTSENR